MNEKMTASMAPICVLKPEALNDIERQAKHDIGESSPDVVHLNGFAQLGLCQPILKALTLTGYTQPTPVQTQAVPACLAGMDVLVSSQTGSGKTAAFMLPALQKLANLPPSERPVGDHKPGQSRLRRPQKAAKPSILVLTPTRELALQVTQATMTYGKFLRHIECVSILGGMPYPKQLQLLSRMPDILVATPGRLLDHVNAKRINLAEVSMLIFDEADRMLDMGFADDIQAILQTMPAARQTMMFSATLNPQIVRLAAQMLKNPQHIEIVSKADSKNINQCLYYADNFQHKQSLLTRLLADDELKQAIVFTATKRGAENLSDYLEQSGHAVGALHGDMHQGARNRTLTGLRRGHLRILVATDVAARGIDVPDITHVINFDLPKAAEDYVHRIGRTGRAGRNGTAINLIAEADLFIWQKIERSLKQRIPERVITGLEPRKSLANEAVRPVRTFKNKRYNNSKPSGPSGPRFSAQKNPWHSTGYKQKTS